MVNLHKGLRKAENVVLTQIQTGRIGFATFLNKIRVPDYPSPVCQYGQANETATHIIMHCSRFLKTYSNLRDYHTGLIDFKSLISRVKRVQYLVK